MAHGNGKLTTVNTEGRNMRKMKSLNLLMKGLLLSLMTLLAGCEGGVLDPKGQIGADEKHLIIIATILMLLVVVPVIVMTLFFAWRYRASNTKATYTPKWAHSGKIEFTVWAIPCAIILILGVIIWETTHALDPYKPLEHEKDHLTVEVVSLDWKWLFIYPELNIATVNELAIPVDTPIAFKLTSESVMNSFFIPQLGTQVYAMAAMQTKLHLIADETGVMDGISANYSGAGFTGMKFKVLSETQQDFDKWVETVRAANASLDTATYDKLAAPTENHPVEYFSSVKPNLFMDIIHKYMPHMKMPHHEDEMDMAEGHHAHQDDAMDHSMHPVTKE